MYQYNDIINTTFFVSHYVEPYNICKSKDEIDYILSNLSTSGNFVIVTNDDGKYLGIYKLSDLLIGKRNIIKYHTVSINDSVQALIKLRRISKQSIIPVLDDNNKIIGVITPDVLKKLIDIDFKEDYYRQAGFTSKEDKTFDDGKRMGRRLPTLFMAFITLFAIGISMTAFLEEIREYPVFVLFQVLILIISSAYAIMVNSKTIYYLRFKKISPNRNIHFVRKEIKKGILIALVLGIITFVVVYFWCVINKKTTFSEEFYASDAMLFSGIISLGLFFSVIEASLIGLGCPIAIEHIHIDVSTSSQLLIRTLTSSICVFIYYLWVMFGVSLI